MKILHKEAFIIIHHGYFCRASLYCTLGWHDPRGAAGYHLFWNDQILLKSLSHGDFPCSFTATASPLNSITLLLLTSINRRELQDCIAKGWDLQGSLRISGLFNWKMQRSIIKHLSSHLNTEAQGTPSASVVKTGSQHEDPLQSCL